MAERAFDLGRVLRNVEAIKSMRAQNARAPYEDELLQLQIGNERAAAPRAAAAESRAAAAESRAATEFSAEQQLTNTRLFNAAMTEIAQNPQATSRWLPQLAKSGLPPEIASAFDGMPPEQVQATARQLAESSRAALQAYQQSNTTRRVQSTKLLDNGNIANVYSDGSIEDTGQRAAPTQGVRPVKLRLPNGQEIDAFLDPTDGSVRGANGTLLSQPTRGGGDGSPTAAAPADLGTARAPEAETRAKELAEADAADLAAAPKRLQAAGSTVAHIDNNLMPVFQNVAANADAWTVGFMSKVAPPGSPAADLKANIDTLTADTAFSTLQEMRDNSPTGGALGSVTERELELLAARRSSLLQSQSPQQFRENLARLQEHVQRVRQIAQQAKQVDLLKTQKLELGRRQQTPEVQQRMQRVDERIAAIQDAWWDSLDTEPGAGSPPPAAAPSGPQQVGRFTVEPVQE